MPRISQFYGIYIYIYHSDHGPPHFHAIYGEHEALIEIETGETLEGSLPRRALKLVREWCKMHHDELLADWALAVAQEPLFQIEPLD